MKPFAKILSALLCAASVFTAAHFTGGMTVMADDKTSLMYTVSESPEQLIAAGSETALLFSVTAPFRAVRIYIARADTSGDKGQYTATLYEWRGGYGQSIYSPEICRREIKGAGTGEYSQIEFGSVPAGQYLLTLTDVRGSVRFELHETANVRTYYNASVHPKALRAEIVWSEGDGGFEGVPDGEYDFVDAGGWVFTDGLGRTCDNGEDDAVREGKTVGLFFHTWHTSNGRSGSRNITEILKEHPEIKNDFTSPLWGHAGSYHWNEPVWGYYTSNDEWVLRRQAELLADAGVDAVFFDNTNGTATFIDDVLTLCKVWSRARADGVKTPQISFMLPMFDYDLVAIQLREIYAKLYGKGLYSELWFYWKGKPLIVGYPGRLVRSDPADKEILDFFNYRVINHSQSSDNVQVQKPDGTPEIMGAIQPEITRKYQLWNWISVYPQLVNRNKDGSPEQVAVAIAHNWCAETHLTAMNNPDYQVFGRHYDPVKGKVDDRPDAKLYGAYFSAQWEYALDIDPEFIWVTGWNEWVAGRFEDFLGVKNAFPDNFSDEYSRDIEPSKGDLKDNYYYQLVSYIRKYKGKTPLPAVDEPVTVDVKTGAGWEKVSRVYRSYGGDVSERKTRGYVNAETNEYYTYKNQTGRNDIVSCRAAYDAENVYFRVDTASALSPSSDPGWMRLFIDVAQIGGEKYDGPSWETFNYVINRQSPAEKALLEKSRGGWDWQSVGEVTYAVDGSTLQIAVPRALLGIGECDSFTLNFKWSDNMQNDGDIMDFYENGDVAPEGRYKYQLSVINAPVPSGETEPAQTSDGAENPSGKGGKGAVIAAAAAGAAIAAGAAAAAVIIKKKHG